MEFNIINITKKNIFVIVIIIIILVIIVNLFLLNYFLNKIFIYFEKKLDIINKKLKKNLKKFKKLKC